MAIAGHHGTMWLLPVVLLFFQTVQTVIPNACEVNNRKCEQFCKAEDDVGCFCAAGCALGNDNRTCLPAVKFPCGKLQRNHEACQEKVTGITASPDAHPENEETTKPPSSHPEVTREAGSLPRAFLLVGEYDERFCGAILNEYFILSGTHCLNHYKNLQVPVGMVDKDNEEPSRAIRVEKIIAHAEFDPETSDNDIALLKLEERITSSEDVVPACLPEEDFAKNVLMNQTFGTVSGFGKMFELTQTVKRMKVLQIPYVDRDNCKLTLHGLVTENMFCAGYDKDGKDVCLGDGGGPHVTQYNSTYFVTGIISWGEGCGRQGKYGVYTNLSKFLPWVRSVLTENS
ncbi:LOW QUALITY PROTEIN: coagulation factor X-like [Pluvialis apricaria]